MTDGPRLSFVVPVHDPPVDVLRRTLASIAAQTEPDVECVLVDDGSKRAEVRAELARWARQDRRFRLVTRPVNGGIAAATNTGLDEVRASVVAFVDHDDLVSPEAASRVLEHFAEHPDHDLVYSDEDLIDEHDRVIAPYRKPDYSPIRHLGHHYLCHLVAMRREAIGSLRVRAEFEPAQDVDFVLQVIDAAHARGRGVGHIARTLYGWRAIAGSTALDAGEKSGVADAVARSVRAALDRRGVAARVEPVDIDGRPSTNLRVTFSAPPIERIDRASVVDAARRLATTEHPYLYIAAGDEPPPTELAAEAARPDVGMAGPALLHHDGTIASTGRVFAPTFADAFAGAPWNVGPWGAFLVTREVSAIAPEGALIDVEAARSAGGLQDDVGLDAGLAELSERMRRRGSATVWSPTTQLHVDELSARRDPDAVADEWSRCRRRLGAITERFDTAGLQHHHVARPRPLRRARDLILAGEIDLVTSDVFDTVVTRPVATPSDLFVHLGDDLARHGLLPEGVTPVQFAMARRAAERAARSTVASRLGLDDRAPECTLDEIWREMPTDWQLSLADVAEHELTNEIRHLRPLAPAVAVLELACDEGVPVALVSDTYLSPDQLRRVLEGCGVPTSRFDRIVTSSGHRRSKADGLLDDVIGSYGVDPTRVLHLGDNDESDIVTAERAGARAVQVSLPAARSFVPVPSPELRRLSRRIGTDGGLTAAIRSAVTDVGPDVANAPYQFGLAAAGPALVGFARWIGATARELGAPSVHYLLREGATIADLVAEVAPDAPRPRIVHASRWVDVRAAVVDGTVSEIVHAVRRRGLVTATHVADAFALDADAVRRVWGGSDALDSSRVWQACESIAADDSLRTAIVEHAAGLRARVVRQLRREVEPGLLDGGSGPLVVCDVGWGGTIQAALERILRSEGIDVEVVGLYLALSEPGEERLARGHRILSYLPNEADDPDQALRSRSIAHHADTIERLLMPEIGTFVDVSEAGDPITVQQVDPHPASLREAKRGMFDLAKQLREHGFDDDVWVRSTAFRGALAAGLAQTITLPTPELARELSQWPHDDVAGADAVPLGGSTTVPLLPYITIRELPMLQQAERAWVEGLAAVEHPTLAAQIAAERLGVQAEHLAPDAVTGMSRLAAFPVGSRLACVQVERQLGVTVDGWSVLRLTGPFPSLRSVRFDATASPALVEIRRWTVRLERQGSPPDDIDVDPDDRGLIWVAAWPLGGGRHATMADGHVVLPVPAELGAEPGRIDTVVVFRRWLLDPSDPLLRRPTRQRLTQAVHRVRRAVDHRLGRA